MVTLSPLELILGTGMITTAAAWGGLALRTFLTKSQCDDCGLGETKKAVAYLIDVTDLIAEANEIPRAKLINLRTNHKMDLDAL